MKLTFGKSQKIKSRKEISRLFKEGRRWECDSFVLIYGQNEFCHNRFGVIVSRKLGNAVTRNKIKRVFREVYRNNPKNIPPFFDILIRPSARDGLFWDVAEQTDFFVKWQKSKEEQN